MAILLLALLCSLFVPASLAAQESKTPCQVEIEVKSCTGAAKAEVDVELEVEVDPEVDDEQQGEARGPVARTDGEGRVHFSVCAETIREVLVFLTEDAPPMASQPLFEPDPESPGKSGAVVIVC